MDTGTGAPSPALDPALHGARGFVLISVIWIVGLLAVIATAFTISVRSHGLAGRNVVNNGRAEYIANGMAMLTALRLATSSDAQSTFKLNGEASGCTCCGSVSVAIAIQDQGGLIDLNTASPQLLEAAFHGLELGAEKATALLSTLRDFRDPDGQSDGGGLEPATYPGKSFGPKNAPLVTPEELDQLPGLDAGKFQKLMGMVTVHSQQPGIDLDRAPAILLQALGITDRTSAQAQSFASPSPGRVFTIDVTAELANHSRYARHAIVSLLRQPDRPFAVLAWQRGQSPLPIATGAVALPCFN